MRWCKKTELSDQPGVGSCAISGRHRAAETSGSWPHSERALECSNREVDLCLGFP